MNASTRLTQLSSKSFTHPEMEYSRYRLFCQTMWVIIAMTGTTTQNNMSMNRLRQRWPLLGTNVARSVSSTIARERKMHIRDPGTPT